MTRARDLSKFANSQALSIGDDFNVGINSSVPTATLDIRGNSVITGVLTATSFSGTVDATGLTGTPDITVNNIVGAAATFSGVVTYEDVTNVDSVGVITARSDVSIADKIIHTGDTNTAIRFPAADTFTVETSGSERIRVDSSGDVGIGTTSPSFKVSVAGGGISAQTSSNDGALVFLPLGASNENRIYSRSSVTGTGNKDLAFRIGDTERLRIDSNGDVEIGSGKYLTWVASFGGNHRGRIKCDSGDAIVFENTNGNSEAMRIDSSQRLLIGTNSSRSTAGTGADLQVETTDAGGRISVVQNRNDASPCPFVVIGKSRGTSIGSNTVLQDDDRIGAIVFAGADGTDMGSDAARIIAEVDGTPGSNDMPGRLIFSTTADGQDICRAPADRKSVV